MRLRPLSASARELRRERYRQVSMRVDELVQDASTATAAERRKKLRAALDAAVVATVAAVVARYPQSRVRAEERRRDALEGAVREEVRHLREVAKAIRREFSGLRGEAPVSDRG